MLCRLEIKVRAEKKLVKYSALLMATFNGLYKHPRNQLPVIESLLHVTHPFLQSYWKIDKKLPGVRDIFIARKKKLQNL